MRTKRVWKNKLENASARIWVRLPETVRKAPITQATGIFRDYVTRLYFPAGKVRPLTRVRLTPPLLLIEYLVYRADAIAERSKTIDLESARTHDYVVLHKYKALFERFLRLMGAWNSQVEERVDLGEQYLRLENAVTSSGSYSRQDAIRLAELRPADVRLLNTLIYALQKKTLDARLQNLLWPVEVLADIGNDLEQYSQDSLTGSHNIYDAFVSLFGEDAKDELRKVIAEYERQFREALDAYSPGEREELELLCKAKYASKLAFIPDPVPTRPPGERAEPTTEPVSKTVMIAGTLCVLAWVVAYASIINRGFSDQSYGMPIAALAANLSWEALYGFVLDPLGDYIHVLSIPCFFIDLIIAWQAWVYGPNDVHSPMVRKHFRKILVGSCLVAMPITYLGFKEFNDPDGEYTGFGINFMMSMLFIGMLNRRGSVAGQSMYAALFKWLGTFLAWVATALTVTTSPGRPYPQSLRSFLTDSARHRDYPLTPLINVMYGVTFLLDAAYARLLYGQLKEAGISPWRRF